MYPNQRSTSITDREAARRILVAKIESCKRLESGEGFSTYDPRFLRTDAERRLRFLDCAPESARFQTAPLQDFDGVPLGPNDSQNLGPGRAMREARERRGVNPLSGAKAVVA